MDISKQFLTKDQINAGITLEEDEDFLKLKCGAETLGTWYALSAKIEDIQNAAEQKLNWIKSGIEFVNRGG